VRPRVIRLLTCLVCVALVLNLAVAVAVAWMIPEGVGVARVGHRHRCAHRHAHHPRRCAKKRHHGSVQATRGQALPSAPPASATPATPSVLAPSLAEPPSAALAPTTPPEGGETPPGGEGGEPPSVPHVQVSAVEYAFTLSRTTVPAGKVIIQFLNDGQDEHNLELAAAEEGPLVGSFEKLPAKGISNLTLEMQRGEYTLFCSLPTHEQKGMKATLTVE
jgi:plastocyanin